MVNTRKRFILFVCAGAFFMTYFSRVSWSVISPYSSLHATLAQNSFVFSLFFVGYVTVQIPAGFLADRNHPATVTAIALVGIALGALFGGLAEQLWLEYLSSIVMGISAGWVYPATLRLIVKVFAGGRELSVATGYYSMSLPLSLTITGGLLPALVLLTNWRWGLLVVTIICAPLAVLAALIKEKFSSPSVKQSSAVNVPRPVQSVFFNRNVMIIGIGGFFFFLSYWYMNLFTYSYFLYIHLDPYEAGLGYSLISIAGIFSSPMLGVIASRWGVKQTTVLSIILYAIFVFAIPATNSIYFIAALSLVIGFLRFLANAGAANMVAIVGGPRTGSTAGMTNVFWQSSGIVGPLIAAFLIGYFGYSISWLVIAGVALASGILFMGVKLELAASEQTTRSKVDFAVQ